MNKFETELLTQSYKQYLTTGDTVFNFVMHNANDFFYYTEAAKYLAEEEYIEALSDNIFDDELSPFDNTLSFKLLYKGADYIKNLK